MPLPPPILAPRVLTVLLSLTACSTDVELLAQLDDHCGRPEPTQLLALRANEVVDANQDAIVAHGDRWLVGISELEAPYAGNSEPNRVVSRRMVSVDACGEGEPRIVAEGVDRVFPPSTEGLPWLGCSNEFEGDMFIIDPDGAQSPIELGVVRMCRVEESPGYWWILRTLAGSTELVAIRVNPDGESYGSWLVSDQIGDWHSSFAVSDEHVWFVDEQLQLFQLDVDLPTNPSVLEEGVGRVVVARDPGFLAWGAEPEFGVLSPWTVYDRQADRRIAVEVGTERDVKLRLVRHSFIFQAELGDGVDGFTQYQLPSLEARTFEGRWGIMLDDVAGNLLLTSRDDGHLYWLPVGASEPELLLDQRVFSTWSDGDEIIAWVGGPGGNRVVRFTTDDLQPEILIDGLHRPLPLDDGRWLDVQPGADPHRGELRLLDPTRDSPQLVDRNVDTGFASFHRDSRQFTLPSDASVRYMIHESGARNGLWSAALAPAD